MNVDDYNSFIHFLSLDKRDNILLDLGNHQFQTEVLCQQFAYTTGSEAVILVKSEDNNTSPKKIKLNNVVSKFHSPPRIIHTDKHNNRLDEIFRYN